MMKTLIIFDVHANFPALEVILKQEKDFDSCILLSDVVDYGPNPIEYIDFLHKNMTYGVMGNHDNAIVSNTDCVCRGDFKTYSVETRKWHYSLLQLEHIHFLQNLPLLNHIETEERSIYMAHASSQGDLFRYLNGDEMEIEIQNITAEIILVGHTHIHFKKQVNNTLIVNSGSVGLARDSAGACYDTLENNIIHLHRIPYNVKKTILTLQHNPISKETKLGLTKVLQETWKGE